jgi:hypothetical protein
MRDGLRWLMPDAPTEAERAEAGAEAAHIADKLLRAALRAGITQKPSDPIGRAILKLEQTLRDEADGLRACVDYRQTPAAIAAE